MIIHKKFILLFISILIHQFLKGQDLLEKEFSFSTSEKEIVNWMRENGKLRAQSRVTTKNYCQINIGKENIEIISNNDTLMFNILSKKYSEIVNSYYFISNDLKFEFSPAFFFSIKPIMTAYESSFEEELLLPIENFKINN